MQTNFKSEKYIEPGDLSTQILLPTRMQIS